MDGPVIAMDSLVVRISHPSQPPFIHRGTTAAAAVQMACYALGLLCVARRCCSRLGGGKEERAEGGRGRGGGYKPACFCLINLFIYYWYFRRRCLLPSSSLLLCFLFCFVSCFCVECRGGYNNVRSGLHTDYCAGMPESDPSGTDAGSNPFLRAAMHDTADCCAVVSGLPSKDDTAVPLFLLVELMELGLRRVFVWGFRYLTPALLALFGF